MLIRNLLIENLYGNDYYLEFNKDLTILHGVNGSGKTTILNIISDICKGSIINLLQYEFDLLKMEIGDSSLVIKLENNTYKIILDRESIEIPKEEGKYFLKKIHSLDSMDMEKKYRNSALHFHEELQCPQEIEKINQNIREIFELTYITLDRNVYGSDFINNKYWKIRHKRRSVDDSGIKRTLRLANEFYINYEEAILREEGQVQRNLENSLLEKMAEPIGNVDFTTPIHNKIDISEMSTILLDETSGKIRSNIEQLIQIYIRNKKKHSEVNLSNRESTTDVCGKINLHTIAAQKYITPQAA